MYSTAALPPAGLAAGDDGVDDALRLRARRRIVALYDKVRNVVEVLGQQPGVGQGRPGALNRDQSLEIFQSAMLLQDADGVMPDRPALRVGRDDGAAVDLAKLFDQLRDVHGRPGVSGCERAGADRRWGTQVAHVPPGNVCSEFGTSWRQ